MVEQDGTLEENEATSTAEQCQALKAASVEKGRELPLTLSASPRGLVEDDRPRWVSVQ